MTTVDLGESFTYGFKLFVVFFGVVVLGGGGLVLGAALAGPELTGGVPDEFATPELIGGLVLGALGVAICGSGVLGLAYKLVADSIRRGSPSDSQRPAAPADEAPREPEQTAEPGHRVGPSPGEQSAREFGPAATVPGAAEVSDRGDKPTTETDPGTAGGEQPDPADEGAVDPEPESGSRGQETDPESGDEKERERTAEEIAFGSNRAESGDRGGSTESPDAAGSEPEPAAEETGGFSGATAVSDAGRDDTETALSGEADDPSEGLFSEDASAPDESARGQHANSSSGGPNVGTDESGDDDSEGSHTDPLSDRGEGT